ncbi:hypothetical protein UFOVP62_40 [uncultured Caudovirales phage]|uniref:Uncharacterized protein n=1 Tax=uncultured Caudovirales phage TaxID=2100421 RepID=A0A6J5KUS2_9CAUD|nr:hypothetical protein UFOVP62_40 [uncultured Caudovirales phage]
MNDDDIVLVDELDLDTFSDPIAQRAVAFCAVARLAVEVAGDEDVRAVVLTMLKKLPASIKTPSTAEVKPLPAPSGGRRL